MVEVKEHILYDYFRSSAAYRVRIALNLKAIEVTQLPINIKPGIDEQLSASFKAINPQARVPYYSDGAFSLGQSSAILEYFEQCYPEVPLLPANRQDSAFVRQIAAIIGCDIHPLNNLSVLNYLKTEFKANEQAITQWYSHWITEGFTALEKLLSAKEKARLTTQSNPFCLGDKPTLADVYLIPQIYNAQRFGVDLTAFTRLMAINTECLKLSAFSEASPDNYK